MTTLRLGMPIVCVGIEHNSKLVLAWHLGRRATGDTEAFTEKLNEATEGQFQITTDGFPLIAMQSAGEMLQ